MNRHHLSYKKVSIEWEIKEFMYLMFRDLKARINSPKFLFSDVKFHFEIHPDGVTIEDIGWVSLYVCQESSLHHRAEFTIGLKKCVDGSVCSSYNSGELSPPHVSGCGTRRFIKRSQLTAANILGKDGTLIVFCNAHLLDDSITETQTSDTFKTLSRDCENIFVTKCHTDVLIDVKGKKFSAHRSILSSRSSVLRSMFELDMKEKRTGSVNITDCDPESFESFLLFLYSGKLDVVASNNALDLYVTAEKYDVQELKEACRECILRDLCVQSVCDVVPLAALHKDKELLKRATDYFVENANKILKTEKWMTFIEENFCLANQLLIKMSKKLPITIIG